MPRNRLSIEIVALLCAKLAALSLIYVAFFSQAAPPPRADAISRHLLNSSPHP